MIELIFTDLETNVSWSHLSTDWVLAYCNFNSNIHPALLRHKQIIEVRDINGHRVKIEARRIKANQTSDNK
jgi:hypothetical protein